MRDETFKRGSVDATGVVVAGDSSWKRQIFFGTGCSFSCAGEFGSRMDLEVFRREKGDGDLGGELSPGLGEKSRGRIPFSIMEVSVSVRSADCLFFRYLEVPFLIAVTSSFSLFCTSGRLSHC